MDRQMPCAQSISAQSSAAQSPAAGRDFAPVLRRVLSARHATLRGLSIALTERGHPTSTPLLGAWRSGALVPGGPEGMAAVGVLEELLDMAPGELTCHLDPDASGARRSRRPATFGDVLPARSTGASRAAVGLETDPAAESVQRARTALGFDRAGQRMIETRVEVLLEVDEQGVARQVTQRMQWVSPAGGVDSFPVVLVIPAPVSGRVRVEPLEGCRLGPSYVDLAEGVFATSLVLPAPLREGEVASTVHRTYLPADVTLDDVYERRVQHEVEEISVTVAFAGRFPVRRTGFVRLDGVEQACDVDEDDGVVRVVRRRFGPGGVGIRWSG